MGIYAHFSCVSSKITAFLPGIGYRRKKGRNEMAKNILTYTGLKELEDELQELKVVKRKEIAEKIKEARAQGDLSENAEYDAAKDEQSDMEKRIEEIEKILKNAEVIDEDQVDLNKINVGCTVKLYDEDFDEEVTYRIVGSTEADILKNKISNECPLGMELIGKTVGETVKVEGMDETATYKILDITRAI